MNHVVKIGLINSKGENHPLHKLTKKQVIEIRKLLNKEELK
jgi:hypothetical protein